MSSGNCSTRPATTRRPSRNISGYRALAVVGLPLVVLLLGVLAGRHRARHDRDRRDRRRPRLDPAEDDRRAHGQQRTARIDYEVPELVDLLVTTIEAGVGFGSALQLSSRRVRDPLGTELG